MTLTFWRTPQNDKITDTLLEFYKSNKTDWRNFAKITSLEKLTMKDKVKIAKVFIPAEILKEATKFNGKGSGKIRFKILHFKKPVFLISDNPILFPRIPIDITDYSGSLIFPISKNRLLVILENDSYAIDEVEIKQINLLLMHQAEQYVGFYDKEILQQFVNAYRHFRNIGHKSEIVKKELFARINRQSVFHSTDKNL